MSSDELSRFQQALEADAALRSEFHSLEEDLATWSAWARSKGFEVSAEDLEELNQEISDEELEEVAGGWTENDPPPPPGGP